MSKYTKAREIIEKEIQDNIEIVDGYCEYSKDIPDDVARKYNYLLQAESLVYTNQLLQLSLKNADFSYCKIMDDNERYRILFGILLESRAKAKLYSNSIYGKNLEDSIYQRSAFIFGCVTYQLNKICNKLCNISEEK